FSSRRRHTRFSRDWSSDVCSSDLMVELPVDWILDDYPYFISSGSLPSPELIFKVYQDEFDGAYKEGTMFMLTMHPMVSGHRSRIVYLDKLIAYMKSKPGVWFATGQQIADYLHP